MLLFLLITQIGLKTENLILADLARYDTPFLAAEITADNPQIKSDKPKSINPIVGEIGFSYIGAIMGLIIISPVTRQLAPKAENVTSVRDIGNTILGLAGGAIAVGSSIGTAFIGKFMNHQGSGMKAFLIASSIVAEGLLLGCFNENLALISWPIIPIGAVIGYNWK